ncbi:AP2/ERF and B3 domain-containing transcription factor At1g51120-like [Phalaenopsis equestris]|uniref:AP2/ERF and B3 domain-containing transcription factor At1g51120-like n=1 Tax=Phalaenopsis equestris TaxID=78828 RepID=UPI0009E5BD01|nr:AP2/ERF and B3 domain-containing transcription factor At1g51120-like [Phalaenopsis equestris]
MHSPREQELFPLNRPKQAETLQLFDEGPSSKIPSPQEVAQVTPRYKGVVLQQNGHWGAQIYVPHGRIWLGTFKSEAAAARAYDSAAIRLHRGESDRNLPLTDITVHEPDFQKLFSTETILNMIRDGSYESRLIEFIRTNHASSSNGSGSDAPTMIDNGITFTEMFQKELTPSDVGKLNRLVIPKKHATRYFPPVTPNCVEEHLLEFRDRMNRLWVFRYCYWKSSQSFVFTRGWNRFVKEMELRSKDTVVFYYCTEMEGMNKKTFFMIDVLRGVGRSGSVEGENPMEDAEGNENSNEYEEEEVKSGSLMDKEESEGTQEMKLFGVWIR